MTVIDFIEIALIKEIKSIQQEGHHYLSFALIAQGIEFLGACIDSNKFFRTGKSRERFNNAILKLFPTSYHHYVKEEGQPYDLYDNLRCGLLHVLLPQNDIELIQESEIEKFGKHLEIKEIRKKQRLLLVSQDLMDDFEDACKNVINKIRNKKISHPKVYSDFLFTEPA